MSDALADARVLVFVDPIERCSYPVTETGYALLYRLWGRLAHNGGQLFVAADEPRLDGATVLAHRVTRFRASPYDAYRSQRIHYDPSRDLGAAPCHDVEPARRVSLSGFEAVMWRREDGPRRALLEALAEIEDDVVVYLSPRLALDPAYSSKVLPERLAPDRTPRTLDTAAVSGEPARKVAAAAAFAEELLRSSTTVIAKPRHGDNGVGITALGLDPTTGGSRPVESGLTALVAQFGDVVVQEYLASVRCPPDLTHEDLPHVPLDRRDFGEVRFLLVDGEVPRHSSGRPHVMARRVPTPNSLVADSGISHPTTLSDEELAFVSALGEAYRTLGIHFGGGDLIRTPDPERPFVFTDAAQSVCGHAVVTGALDGAPYGVIDQVVDSLARRVHDHRSAVV
ncbi:MAG: hypothetical protein AAF211_12175 [Myxococcota bacterium]